MQTRPPAPPVSVLLIGLADQIASFKNALSSGNQRNSAAIGVDFFYHTEGNVTYQIWDIPGLIRRRALWKSYMQNKDAIIYFGQNEDYSKIFQDYAPEGCKLIVYDAKKMNPKNCLKDIQPDWALVKEVNSKMRLILAALFSQDSFFNLEVMPYEIIKIMTNNFLRLSFSEDRAAFSFFKSPSNLRQPEYLETKQEEKTSHTLR